MSRSFRHALASRLVQIAATAAAPACVSTGPHCSGGPVGDPVQVCVAPVSVTDAGAVDAGVGDPCPDGATLDNEILATNQVGHFFDIQAGPTREGAQCCYVVQRLQDCTGRPFLVDDRAMVAAARHGGDGWNEAGVATPRVDHLDAETRAALAAQWAKDGLAEHASVASFGRFALELMAVGAPAELIALAHRAALDEIRHAQLCLQLASAYADEPIAPGPFPFAGGVEVSNDLASIAARAAREGCIGETLAAIAADERCAETDDPAVRAVLATIADDEARHAELAWRTVAWAVRTGGARVRRAVAAAFASLDERAGVADVVRPAAAALLAG
jgi:hypothetical protein